MALTSKERVAAFRAKQKKARELGAIVGLVKPLLPPKPSKPADEQLTEATCQKLQSIAERWEIAHSVALKTLTDAAADGDIKAATVILEYSKTKPVTQVQTHMVTSNLDPKVYTTSELRQISELYKRQSQIVDSTATSAATSSQPQSL